MAPYRKSIRWSSSRVRSRIVGTLLDGRSGSDWSLSWRMTDHWPLVNLSIELVLTVLQGLKKPDLFRIDGQTDLCGAFVARHHFEIRVQSLAQQDRRMFQSRIGNGAENNLFGTGAYQFAESSDARPAGDDHNVSFGYRHR